MEKSEFIEFMKTKTPVRKGMEVFDEFHKLSEKARKITMEINNKYHTKEELTE